LNYDKRIIFSTHTFILCCYTVGFVAIFPLFVIFEFKSKQTVSQFNITFTIHLFASIFISWNNRIQNIKVSILKQRDPKQTATTNKIKKHFILLPPWTYSDKTWRWCRIWHWTYFKVTC